MMQRPDFQNVQGLTASSFSSCCWTAEEVPAPNHSSLLTCPALPGMVVLGAACLTHIYQNGLRKQRWGNDYREILRLGRRRIGVLMAINNLLHAQWRRKWEQLLMPPLGLREKNKWSSGGKITQSNWAFL